jgi:hypothetical protein
MTESVGNNEIWQIWNLPSKVHFCNNKHNRHNQKCFQCRLKLKNPVSANYETKNTSTFQLFHCQQIQSLLITLYVLCFLSRKTNIHVNFGNVLWVAFCILSGSISLVKYPVLPSFVVITDKLKFYVHCILFP